MSLFKISENNNWIEGVDLSDCSRKMFLQCNYIQLHIIHNSWYQWTWNSELTTNAESPWHNNCAEGNSGGCAWYAVLIHEGWPPSWLHSNMQVNLAFKSEWRILFSTHGNHGVCCCCSLFNRFRAMWIDSEYQCLNGESSSQNELHLWNAAVLADRWGSFPSSWDWCSPIISPHVLPQGKGIISSQRTL